MPSPLAQAIMFQQGYRPPQSAIAPTDVIGAYNLSSDIAEKNYQAQLAKQQATFGGLASLGSAGILGFGKPITESLAQKLFGAGAKAATDGTAPAAASAAVAPTPSGTAMAWPFTGNTATVGDTGMLPVGGANATAPATAGVADIAPTSSGTSMAWPFGGGATVVGDAAPGTVAGDVASAAPAAADAVTGTVAGDLAAAAPAADAVAAGGDAALASLPEWLTSFIPFLLA